MTAVPLLDDGFDKNNRSIRSSINRFTSFLSSAIAGKDELTVACEKAASIHTSSYSPKDKHLQYIIDQVDENPNLIEDILLRFSALTKWAEDPVVAIKILSCAHQLVRRVPTCLLRRSDSFIVFLDEIRNHWSAQQVVFVDQYSSALLHLVLTARQHYQLYENTLTRGMGVSVGITFFQGEEISVYVSKLLGFQERLSTIIRIPNFPSSPSLKNPAQARRAACTIIVEHCKLLLSIIRCLVLHMENMKDQQQPIDTAIFRDQMDEQEKFLQAVERDFL
jgi:hypothetical protein